MQVYFYYSFITRFLGKNVAAKIVRRNKKQISLSLHEENAINLIHQNIVAVIDVLYQINSNYGVVIMEYIPDSRELQSIIHDRNVNISSVQVVGFGIDICRGLQFCHDSGILHLDVKPANILVCYGSLCKLCDFGNSMKVGVTTSRPLHLVSVLFLIIEIMYILNSPVTGGIKY